MEGGGSKMEGGGKKTGGRGGSRPKAETGKDKKKICRPMNGFILFCQEHRRIVQEKNPELDNRNVTRVLGDLWAKLTPADKDAYNLVAKKVRFYNLRESPIRDHLILF